MRKDRGGLGRVVPFLLTAALLAGCSAAPEESGNSYRQITMDEAATLMEEEEDYILLDVRTRAEFADKHIPGAVCVPNETIGEELPPELPDREALILVYCRSGNRSRQASQKLADLGYTNVVECGGINDWPGDTVSGEA